jgi:hypothetical protein
MPMDKPATNAFAGEFKSFPNERTKASRELKRAFRDSTENPRVAPSNAQLQEWSTFD